MSTHPRYRCPGPVAVTYSTSAPGSTQSPVTEYFDFLIVACDPRVLEVSDRSEIEQDVEQKLSSFTFNTTLWSAKRPDGAQFGSRFHPGVLQSNTGEIHSFRDEGMTRTDGFQQDPLGTFLTVYQLKQTSYYKGDRAKIEQDFARSRNANLSERSARNKWLDFGPNLSSNPPEPEESHVVDYFPHFSTKDLRNELPWKLMDIQGENRTIYVSSHTCFESVLHIFLYIEQIMKLDKVKRAFPTDKQARFAVCGAGPAGLLFASQQLVQRGFKNVKIFEKESGIGGKTITRLRQAPSTKQPIVCELGTCYLSANYFPLFPLFEKYDAGAVVEFDDGNNFRSVIDPSVARTQNERDNGVEFKQWTARKNGNTRQKQKIQLVLASIKYLIVHYAVMGTGPRDAMPHHPPFRSSGDGKTSVFARLARVIRLAIKTWDAADEDDDEIEAEALLKVLPTEESACEAARVIARQGVKGELETLEKMAGDATVSEEKTKLDLKELNSTCNEVMTKPFAEFLDDNGMGILKPLFVYAYSVQGYGSIDKIPAYYGLLWVTPFLIQYNIMSELGMTGDSGRGVTNIVTKGWGELWTQIVSKENLCIETNTDILSITREPEEKTCRSWNTMFRDWLATKKL